MKMNYLVYDDGELLAGFMSLCAATSYIEGWRYNDDVPVDLVSGDTGEILSTWINGTWKSEN